MKYSDIVDWFEKHVEQKKNLRGTNSFIASHPYEEFQMDLMFLSDLKDKEYSSALLMIDIFTKHCSIIPVKSKNSPTKLLVPGNAIFAIVNIKNKTA